MISSWDAYSKTLRSRFLRHGDSLFITTVALFFSLSLCASAAYAFQAVFSWDPPTTNTDGTPLTDLAGYKVYYGTASGNYTQNVDVGNVTTYAASNLTVGVTYYFAATAYDTAGNQSNYSTEVATLTSIPTGQQVFTIDPPVASPVYTMNLYQARPIGVGPTANGGSALDIQVGTIQFAGPVDIYFGIFAPPIDPVNIYVLTPTVLYPVAEGLVPWKANTLGINEDIFGTIPVSALPQGTYYLYLGVTPSGSIRNYYLWQTSFTVH